MTRRALIFDGPPSPPSKAKKSASIVWDVIPKNPVRNGAACRTSAGSSGRRMADNDDVTICDFCRRGQVIKSSQEIGFYQWTDRGYLYCRATVPVGVCDQCGMKSWDDRSEAIIEDAVRRAIEDRS